MARKVKLSNLQQTDIVSAIKGRDTVIEEDKPEIDEPKTKKIGLFDFVNDIRKFKKSNLLEKEENEKAFDSFMILRALSMKDDDVLLCNEVNPYTGILTKKQMYDFLLSIIPKDYAFYQWIGNKKEDSKKEIKIIAKYFQCSEQQASEYLSIMGEEWAKAIQSKFGDFDLIEE